MVGAVAPATEISERFAEWGTCESRSIEYPCSVSLRPLRKQYILYARGSATGAGHQFLHEISDSGRTCRVIIENTSTVVDACKVVETAPYRILRGKRFCKERVLVVVPNANERGVRQILRAVEIGCARHIWCSNIEPEAADRRKEKQTHTGVSPTRRLFFEIQVPAVCYSGLCRPKRESIFDFKHGVFHSGCDMVSDKTREACTTQIFAPYSLVNYIIVAVNQHRRGSIRVATAILGSDMQHSTRYISDIKPLTGVYIGPC